MIPIQLQYQPSLIEDFRRRTLDLKHLVAEIDHGKWRSQKEIRFSPEYSAYRDTIKEFGSEIFQAYSNQCIYCSKEATILTPIHPIEKNFEFHGLCQEIYNIYVLCHECHQIVKIDYLTPQLELPRIRLSDLMRKVPNFVLPTFEPTHKYLVNFFYPTDQEINTRLEFTLRNISVNDLEQVKGILDRKYNRQEAGAENIYESYWDLRYKDSRSEFQIDLAYANSLPVPQELRQNRDIQELLRVPRRGKILLDIQFSNLRSLGEDRISFYERESLCLIGDNGLGKTTFLNALSFIGPAKTRKKISHSTDNYQFDPKRNTTFRVDFLDTPDMYTQNMKSAETVISPNPSFPRSSNQVPICYVNEKRTGSAFIKQFTKMLMEDDDVFHDAAKIFSFVLDLKFNEGLVKENGSIRLEKSDGTKIKLFETSSGARSIFFIMYSILKTFGKNYIRESSSEGTYHGFVLIDEIELHLHPKWKLGIVAKFKRMYPDLYFVVTTHDPLVIHGLSNKEVLLLERPENSNKTIITKNLPDIENYTIDLLLTSPYFGLDENASYMKDTASIRNTNLGARTYRERLIKDVYQKSLDMNIQYTNDEIAMLVAHTFVRKP